MHQESNQQRAILAVLDEEAVAMQDGNLRRYLALLTDDPVLLPPNLLPKAGAELREWLGDFLHRFQVEWLAFVHHETVVSTNLAYHIYSYTWRVTPKNGGAATVASGKGLHVLRRIEDCSWRIAREIWNPNPAA